MARLAGFSGVGVVAALVVDVRGAAGTLMGRAAAAADAAADPDAAVVAREDAGAVKVLLLASIGANASIRSSVMVKPEYSSGAKPSS